MLLATWAFSSPREARVLHARHAWAFVIEACARTLRSSTQVCYRDSTARRSARKQITPKELYRRMQCNYTIKQQLNLFILSRACDSETRPERTGRRKGSLFERVNKS